jgi:hypothetical protein
MKTILITGVNLDRLRDGAAVRCQRLVGGDQLRVRSGAAEQIAPHSDGGQRPRGDGKG